MALQHQLPSGHRQRFVAGPEGPDRFKLPFLAKIALYELQYLRQGYEPTDLHATIPDMTVATADPSDAELDRNISQVLKTLRERLNMDVVFVSEFLDGRRVFRQVSASDSRPTVSLGQSDALEASWCQQAVAGRLPRYIADAKTDPTVGALLDQLPRPIGTHIRTPVVLKNGENCGTLCCFSFSPNDSANLDDLKTLEMTALLTAPKVAPDWDLKRDWRLDVAPDEPRPACSAPNLQPVRWSVPPAAANGSNDR